MPGRFFLTRPAGEVSAFIGAEVPEDPPRRNIAPGQQIIARSANGAGPMRWGIIPVGRKNARGRPVMETLINARSETVFDKSAYEGVGRAVVPVEGWYEWTGAARRKTAWEIRPRDGGLMALAAICDTWRAPGGQEVAQVATVTCEPNADVRPIHHRMAVILEPETIETWLTGTEAEAAELMRPWPDGRLTVAEAVGVDWNGP
ncbi:SOS response-associated peptidase [Histidinibacterium aquaticum]|uniref:Abasic site processing protein n=1 Tax=Histidinibacterium aquaticum TaxID=2613962 RepID=A0A5J5GPT9_9RHOB|nr:SOS response-associated peptidase [Histidinibacterium aquaticum]KAA9010067.1 SOS response-associated peptidase [Histidinibacterium aquaticum]